jgi:hypothetical protein
MNVAYRKTRLESKHWSGHWALIVAVAAISVLGGLGIRQAVDSGAGVAGSEAQVPAAPNAASATVPDRELVLEEAQSRASHIVLERNRAFQRGLSDEAVLTRRAAELEEETQRIYGELLQSYAAASLITGPGAAEVLETALGLGQPGERVRHSLGTTPQANFLDYAVVGFAYATPPVETLIAVDSIDSSLGLGQPGEGVPVVQPMFGTMADAYYAGEH